jgi:hypothetical protein
MRAIAYVAGISTRADTVREVLLCFAVVRCPFCGRLHLHRWPTDGFRYERQPICGAPRGYLVTPTPRAVREHTALTRPQHDDASHALEEEYQS